jgi:hypothetical protein
MAENTIDKVNVVYKGNLIGGRDKPSAAKVFSRSPLRPVSVNSIS